MNEELINEIELSMLRHLNNDQYEKLHETLVRCIGSYLPESKTVEHKFSNDEMIMLFISAKDIEGRSPKTLKYYRGTLNKLIESLNKHVTQMTTEDLRTYLSSYQMINNCSKANIDNIRRNISSFFSWLEEEDYIIKSPMKRIHKIKTEKTVKDVYTDEALELLRDNCKTIRDLAIIDLLVSTGMRVGELVKLNIDDINFDNRECIVFGKGSKERLVYFDAKTKIHLLNYINTRKDNNPALFVSLNYPFKRLQISGIEIRLRELGRSIGIKNVHPHKFRRTLATKAIDKGMPVEQVQRLLGHSKIDTTMHYAMVDQNNVKMSHRRYIA